MNPIKLVLLDRDGTINVDTHYLSDPTKVTLLPCAANGLRRMRALGLKLAIVSNQSGISHGFYTTDTVEAINRRLIELLEAEGAGLDSIHYCPHQPSDECDCRKPRIGLLEEAAHYHGIPLSNAIMIGDNFSDLEAAKNAQIPSILVRTGYGSLVEQDPSPMGALAIVDTLEDAAQHLEGILLPRTDPSREDA